MFFHVKCIAQLIFGCYACTSDGANIVAAAPGGLNHDRASQGQRLFARPESVCKAGLLCGCTEMPIPWDAHRSDGADGVAVALGGLEHDPALKDLDVAAFSRAPPQAMAACLDYIECASVWQREFHVGCDPHRPQTSTFCNSCFAACLSELRFCWCSCQVSRNLQSCGLPARGDDNTMQRIVRAPGSPAASGSGAMPSTFALRRVAYGGIERYLDSIEFGERERTRLRNALSSEPDASAAATPEFSAART